MLILCYTIKKTGGNTLYQTENLRELTRILERNLDTLNVSDCCKCSVTTAQCHALVEIGRRKNSMLKDLANILQIDISTASKVVEELVQKGLVLREPSSLDRRRVQLNITPKGKNIFQNIETDMNHIFDEVLSLLDPTEQTQVLIGLRKFNQAIEKWNIQKNR